VDPKLCDYNILFNFPSLDDSGDSSSAISFTGIRKSMYLIIFIYNKKKQKLNLTKAKEMKIWLIMDFVGFLHTHTL
jgi:hypothetical protein